MKHTLHLALLGAALLTVAAPGASAQEVTPTHTFEIPLILDAFHGQVSFATLIAPPAGESILKTELHISWTTNSTQPAAEFGMELSGSFEPGQSQSWFLTGADLGWPAATGSYSAVVTTDLLNGTLMGGLPGFPTIMHLTLDAAGGGGLHGAVGKNSKLVLHLGPRMDADVGAVSLSAGGTQTLSLKAGPTVGPGMLYLVAGSATGTLPGLTIDGVQVLLLPDAYMGYTFVSANQGPFAGTLGLLDGSGKGTAQLVIPAGAPPGLAGLVLHHAMLGIDPQNGTLSMCSNPVDLLLLL